MSIRTRAIKTYYGLTAAEILTAPENHHSYKIVYLGRQNHAVTPYLHRSDSADDSEITICDWDEATYLRLEPQYDGRTCWLSTGLDLCPAK